MDDRSSDHPTWVIDGHAHLDRVVDSESCLTEARQLGVQAIVAVGMDARGNRFNLELAKRYRGFVYAAVGLHPWMVEENSLAHEIDFVSKHLEKAVALGEVGLDYKIGRSKSLQKKAFRMMLEEAAFLDKPVISHSRYSHARTLEMIREAGIRFAVFHWYSGPLDVLHALLRQGYFISATPALAYSHRHQEAVKEAPLERILLETDTPVSYQGIPSRPAHVLRTLELVAKIKSLDRELVARLTSKNASNLYGLELPKSTLTGT